VEEGKKGRVAAVHVARRPLRAVNPVEFALITLVPPPAPYPFSPRPRLSPCSTTFPAAFTGFL